MNSIRAVLIGALACTALSACHDQIVEPDATPADTLAAIPGATTILVVSRGGVPIQGANVTMTLKGRENLPLGFVADRTGRVELPLTGEVSSIRVRALGFVPYRGPVPRHATIELEAARLETSCVVVTPSR